MDKFSKIITTDVMNIKECISSIDGSKILRLDISFDKFQEFINKYSPGNINLPLLWIVIHDEDIIASQEDINLRYKFLKVINELNFRELTFKLSDSTMPIYNTIMEKIGWKHVNKTYLFMSVDRNPITKKDLKLLSAQGRIIMQEEKLIWVPTPILYQLLGIVDEATLDKAIKLKKIVFQYYKRLNNMYHTEDFTEFDKIWLAYNFVIKQTVYAEETVRKKDEEYVFYNPDNKNSWALEPLGTYVHKKGVCGGQSRLMKTLLNNQYFKSDTVVICGPFVCDGKVYGYHAWVGSVVDNRLYQTCLTMAGPFKDLDDKCYVPDDNEIYPKIYTKSSLSNQEIIQTQLHIKRLRK